MGYYAEQMEQEEQQERDDEECAWWFQIGQQQQEVREDERLQKADASQDKPARKEVVEVRSEYICQVSVF